MKRGAAGAWRALEAELAAWHAAGRVAGFWWRDDDAVAPSAALDRLLDLAAGHRADVALAVIPARAEPALARSLAEHPARTAVLQHGYAHLDHAPAGAKKCELVAPEARPAILEELARGRDRLEALLGERLLPVMVPPWNRIDAALLRRLPALGFAALSTYKARPCAAPAPGLLQVNCHLDILQWRPERCFVGTDAALALLTGHLAAKRSAAAEDEEPTGILTHHQVHDADAWDFFEALLSFLGGHEAARLMPPRAVFAPALAGNARPAAETRPR
ncbi:MAG TPA: polysaccharide deacetylase family protein [Kiloniellaceae bacterium]|nr:polysaccharide deacetylase family protein [Kiloniellaceae bacterium]